MKYSFYLDEKSNCTLLINVLFFLTGPPNVTAKPQDPPTAPSLSFTVAHTQAPTGPPSTVASTVTPTTTAAAATISPTREEDVQQAGPNGTRRVLPVPPPQPDPPQESPSTQSPPLPNPVGENNGTTFAPNTPTPEPYTDDDDDALAIEETTTESDMDFSTEPSPHGECTHHGIMSKTILVMQKAPTVTLG